LCEETKQMWTPETGMPPGHNRAEGIALHMLRWLSYCGDSSYGKQWEQSGLDRLKPSNVMVEAADADGKVLASRFESAGAGRVRLLVEESAARYPITIDPIAQQAYLKVGDAGYGGGGDAFGGSVAVSGVWEMAAGVIVDPFKGEVFSTAARYGAFLDGVPIRVSTERLADAVVATGFAPNQASLRPMARGIVAVGARARTVRMLGSAAIMLAWVACGRLSAYFEADLNAWDTAAGVLLVREAGGLVTELSGAPFGIASRPLLAANAAAHAELRDTLVEANVIGLDPE
jgi:hypothetical protein